MTSAYRLYGFGATCAPLPPQLLFLLPAALLVGRAVLCVAGGLSANELHNRHRYAYLQAQPDGTYLNRFGARRSRPPARCAPLRTALPHLAWPWLQPALLASSPPSCPLGPSPPRPAPRVLCPRPPDRGVARNCLAFWLDRDAHGSAAPPSATASSPAGGAAELDAWSAAWAAGERRLAARGPAGGAAGGRRGGSLAWLWSADGSGPSVAFVVGAGVAALKDPLD